MISQQLLKVEGLYLAYQLTLNIVLWDREWAFSCLFFRVFSSFYFALHFLVKDISTNVLDWNFIFGILVVNNKFCCGLENWHIPTWYRV